MEIKRTRQCKHCPWKISTDPRKDIPGYQQNMHEHLKDCIAEPGDMYATSVMACHADGGKNDIPCVGWLVNQLGPGNNIHLRMKLFRDPKAAKLKVVGPQHPNFESTIPTPTTSK